MILEVRPLKSASPLNRDLEGAVVSHLVRTQLPVQLQFDATPVTTITSLATLKILVPADALLQPTADAHRAVNFKAYGQFENTVSRRIESWFECDNAPSIVASDRAADAVGDRVRKTVDLARGRL